MLNLVLSVIFASTVFVLVSVSVVCVFTLAQNIVIFVIRVPIMVLILH